MSRSRSTSGRSQKLAWIALTDNRRAPAWRRQWQPGRITRSPSPPSPRTAQRPGVTAAAQGAVHEDSSLAGGEPQWRIWSSRTGTWIVEDSAISICTWRCRRQLLAGSDQFSAISEHLRLLHAGNTAHAAAACRQSAIWSPITESDHRHLAGPSPARRAEGGCERHPPVASSPPGRARGVRRHPPVASLPPRGGRGEYEDAVRPSRPSPGVDEGESEKNTHLQQSVVDRGGCLPAPHRRRRRIPAARAG